LLFFENVVTSPDRPSHHDIGEQELKRLLAQPLVGR
jgi:hypothetical protein